MLNLLIHIVAALLAGIGLFTVIVVALDVWPSRSATVVVPQPLAPDPDRIWQLYPEDLEGTAYDATVRRLRRLEREAAERLRDVRLGRP